MELETNWQVWIDLQVANRVHVGRLVVRVAIWIGVVLGMVGVQAIARIERIERRRLASRRLQTATVANGSGSPDPRMKSEKERKGEKRSEKRELAEFLSETEPVAWLAGRTHLRFWWWESDYVRGILQLLAKSISNQNSCRALGRCCWLVGHQWLRWFSGYGDT